MRAETICIPIQQYVLLRKKEEIADDLILQLKSSLHDLETGKVRRVR